MDAKDDKDDKDVSIDVEVGKFKTFEDYQASDLYKETKKKQIEELKIPDYLLEVALYGYWRDQYLYTLNSSSKRKFLADEKKREKNITKLMKNVDKDSELKNIEVLSADEHFKKYGELKVEGIKKEGIEELKED